MEWQRHESLPSMSHFYGVLEFEMHFTIFLTDELMPKEFFFFSSTCSMSHMVAK